MRAVLLRSVAVILVGAAVLAGVLWIASTIDARAPTVLSFSLSQPLPDDERVALITTSLEVAFSEPVEQDAAAAALRIEPEVEGVVSWSGSTMTFTPGEPLELETAYTVTLQPGVRDASGNEMSEVPEPFTFETAGRPLVVETIPERGADDVPLEGAITVRFSTLMDTASVEAALRLRPAFSHEVRWSGEVLEIVPDEPLDPDREYGITIGQRAADVAGVALGSPFDLDFRTIVPGLEPVTLVPADSTDGIATTSPIAVIFDRPIDPESVSPDLLTVTPEVAGSLEVAVLPGNEPREDGAGRLLSFVPSGPLPPNTTFVVELAPGLLAIDGGGLAEPIEWRFTTGAPQPSLSNQITFLSDRSGVTNLWAMNPDGTGQRQLSTELVPVLDYALAPDGTAYVVADGQRLIAARADGSDRRVLTDTGLLEFDPAFSPDGQSIAFGRADAETQEGLGLWRVPVDGGEASAIELPDELLASPPPSGSASGWLRSPRFSPDGGALAFVEPGRSVAILELPGERLTRAQFIAVAPAQWLPDSSGILLTGAEEDHETDAEPLTAGRVLPLAPPEDAAPGIGLFRRSGTRVQGSSLGEGVVLAGIAADGRVAYLDRGELRIADDLDDEGGRVLASDVAAASFGPAGDLLVIVVRPEGDPEQSGRISLLDPRSREQNVLVNDGWRPRWLP